MNAAEFARRRERIMHHSPGRSDDWRKRAMKRLAADAGAEPKTTRGGRIVSYRMKSGGHVCVKHRYRNETAATNALTCMQRERDGRRKPIRAYQCDHCHGWHITSQV
jgi:hypothetical protein